MLKRRKHRSETHERPAKRPKPNPKDLKWCHCTPQCRALIGKRQRERHYAKARKAGKGDQSRDSTSPGPQISVPPSPRVPPAEPLTSDSEHNFVSEHDFASEHSSEIIHASSSQADSLSDPAESEPGFFEDDSEGEGEFADFKAIADADVCQLIARIEQEYELELSRELYQMSKFFFLGGGQL